MSDHQSEAGPGQQSDETVEQPQSNIPTRKGLLDNINGNGDTSRSGSKSVSQSRRRNILKASASIFSMTGLQGALSNKGTDRIKVPKYLGADGVKEWMKVPRKWYNHYHGVIADKEDFDTHHQDYPGIARTSVTGDPDRKVAGKTAFQIEVSVDTDEQENEIPTKWKGTPVEIVEAAEAHPAGQCSPCTTCFVNDCYWPNLPGGTVIQSKETGSVGTIMCLIEKGGIPYVLTAAHLGDVCDGKLDQGDKFHQRNRTIGEVEEYSKSADYVLVDGSGGNHDKTDILHDGDEEHEINGVVSETAIGDLIDSDPSDGCEEASDPVYEMGWTTGRTKGCVIDTHVKEWFSPCWTFDSEGVEFSNKNADGDSGGPVFVDNGGWVYMVCMYSTHYGDAGSMCGGRKIGETGAGTAAYHLRNNYNMTFDTNWDNGIDCSNVTDCKSC